MKEIEQLEKAFRIYDEIKTITHPLILYALQRTVEEQIEQIK